MHSSNSICNVNVIGYLFPCAVTLSPSGRVLLCEGETLKLSCRGANMSAQWNVTGIHEKTDFSKNPLLLGPVSTVDSGATVQCEASGQTSHTTHLFVGEIVFL